jgi:hypothetical protein
MVEVTPDYEPPARTQINMDRYYEGTAATDGTDIGSRKKRKEYMKRHGLADADDFKETWAKAQREREEFRAGRARDPLLREQLNRAFYEAQNKRSRRK